MAANRPAIMQFDFKWQHWSWTLYDMTRQPQFSLPWFLTNTFSPSENWRTLECLSRSNCCLLCFSATFCFKFGLSISNLEQSFLPNNIFNKWQTSGCMWFDSVLEQKSCYAITWSTHWWLAKSSFEHLYSSFSQSIWQRLIQCNSNMSNSIQSTELLKLGCCKLWTIIWHDRFWNSKLGKQLSQSLDGCEGGSCCLGKDLNPLWVSINHY